MARMCRNEQVCQERKSVKRFEQSNGLDTALYKNYLLHFRRAENTIRRSYASTSPLTKGKRGERYITIRAGYDRFCESCAHCQTTQKTDLVSSQFISDSVCSRRLHGSSGSSALLSVFPLLQRANPGARLTLQDRLAISVNLQLHNNNLQRGTTYEGAVGSLK